MNIFILSKDPHKAAQYQCDKHVVKMILETAQLLSTAHWETGSGLIAPYKSTHKNHPCAIWTRASADNYDWLVKHGHALLQEYNLRYDKFHKTTDAMCWLDSFRPNLPDMGLTPFTICMPDHCKVEGKPVASYRNYYRIEKSHFAKWKLGNIPNWFY